jgi:hypothetical protein
MLRLNISGTGTYPADTTGIVCGCEGNLLAALVPPKPSVNLTRHPGVFAPNSRHRVSVTPARRGKASQKTVADQDEKTPVQSHLAMTGFCSCKTGIHAIHGNNLGSDTETGVQH